MTNSQPGSAVVYVPSSRMEEFHLLMTRLNSKAERYNVPPIRIVSQVAQAFKAVNSTERDGDLSVTTLVRASQVEEQSGVYYELQRIELSNPIIKLGSWRVIGKLEHEQQSGKSLSYAYSSRAEDVAAINRYQAQAICCEHCNTARKRGSAYVLVNDAGEYKEVGGSCLETFTGVDAAKVLFLARFVQLVSFYDPDSEGYGRGPASLQPTKYWLADVVFTIRHFQFLSATRARELGDGCEPTYAIARNLHSLLRKEQAKDSGTLSLIDSYLRTRNDDIETGAKVIEWFKQKPSTSDSFTNNARILLSNELMADSKQHLAFTAAAVNQYLNAMRDLTYAGTSTHQGEEGEKMERSLRIDDVRRVQSQYGEPYRFTFRDASGNCYSWKAAAPSPILVACSGATIKASFKVKRHSEFKGVLQTDISHLKVMAWEQVHEPLINLIKAEPLLVRTAAKNMLAELVPHLSSEGAQQLREALLDAMAVGWQDSPEWGKAQPLLQSADVQNFVGSAMYEDDQARCDLLITLNIKLRELGINLDASAAERVAPQDIKESAPKAEHNQNFFLCATQSSFGF